jgi:hypothetical protein
MHGLVNRAIQGFLTDTYGVEVWRTIVREAELGFDDFEPMLSYPSDLTGRVLDVASDRLGKTRDDLLEDVGTYLVSHRNVEGLRRLLRFGGSSFVDFLYSLDDLPDRARLAMPDLRLPRVRLVEAAPNRFMLHTDDWELSFGRVLVGMLRAMADDYGTLAILEIEREADGRDRITIAVHDARFAAAKDFDLARPHLP